MGKNSQFNLKILIKGITIFIMVNFLFIPFSGISYGNISLYNIIFPGRERFPFGENYQRSYNISLFDINAMFASLEVNDHPKQPSEFRVFIIGDSSVWGTLLENKDTIAGILNSQDIHLKTGKKLVFYNLGYPSLSLFKDLMIMDRSLKYYPDLILWLVTLESFPSKNQIDNPLVANNPQEIERIIKKYSLEKIDTKSMIQNSFWDLTLIGQRRRLADNLRLQLLGFLWSATGIDQDLSQGYTLALRDFENDETFHNQNNHVFVDSELSFDIIKKAINTISTPIILVNEPILISNGVNSNIRYNFYYPRWAFDQYRELMTEITHKYQMDYYDLWDIIPENEFTNSAIHLTPSGEEILSEELKKVLKNEIINKS